MSNIRSIIFYPIFTKILEQRLLSSILIIIPILILLLNITGIYQHKCLFYEITKLPCPACGITRAFSDIFTGHFISALKLHILSIIVFLLWALTAVITFTPFTLRKRIIEKISKIETKTAFFLALLIIYLCYGIARMFMLQYNLY